MRLAHSVNKLFKDIQYNDMKQDNNTRGIDMDIINRHRRKKGLLRRSQLDIMSNYDRDFVNRLQL